MHTKGRLDSELESFTCDLSLEILGNDQNAVGRCQEGVSVYEWQRLSVHGGLWLGGDNVDIRQCPYCGRSNAQGSAGLGWSPSYKSVCYLVQSWNPIDPSLAHLWTPCRGLKNWKMPAAWVVVKGMESHYPLYFGSKGIWVPRVCFATGQWDRSLQRPGSSWLPFSFGVNTSHLVGWLDCS